MTCIYCGVDLNDENSYKGRNVCKKCISIKNKDRYKRKKDEILKQKKEYYYKNKSIINDKNKDRYKKNITRYRKIIHDRRKFLRKNDPEYRIHESISKRLRESLKGKKSKPTFEYLEYTESELKEHIESQFDNNMSWENYGSYWHIDHIIPRKIFDFSKEEDIKKCWNIKNLRPLSAKENIKKGGDVSLFLIKQKGIEHLLPKGDKL